MGYDQGYLESSPVARCKLPTAHSREVYIDHKQWRTIIDSIQHQRFKDVLLFLRHTGCRPFELRRIEARHDDGKCIEFERAVRAMASRT